MKSLYNRQDAYNKHGNKLAEEFRKLSHPVIKDMLDKGFRARDISNIMCDQIQYDCIFEGALRRFKE